MSKWDAPCSGCGKTLKGNAKSLPAGVRMCQSCRSERWPGAQPCTVCGLSFTPRPAYASRPSEKTCSSSCGQRVRVESPVPCDDCGELTTRGSTQAGRFCAACAKARTQARWSRKRVARQAAERFTDITTAFESQMRQRARRCPLCSVRMTDTPGLPSSKHLDHIIPIHVGGTHTIGNVRIICRTCNLGRPKDGSDLECHQPTLWAQDHQAAELLAECKPDRRRRCLCGALLRKGRCWTCQPSRGRAARPDDGRRGAEMRARGVQWQAIADELGFSGTGAAYICAQKWGEPDVVARWPKRYEKVG